MSAAILSVGTSRIQIVSSFVLSNEVKNCLTVFALLAHDWALVRFDTTLVVLSNCYWMFLLDAEILQKLFQIKCFFSAAVRPRYSASDGKRSTVFCYLTTQLSAVSSPLSLKQNLVVGFLSFTAPNKSALLSPVTSCSCVSRFYTFWALKIQQKLFCIFSVVW